MQKRVFIIHGWGGSPDEGWLPWIKKELETRGFEVSVPWMPNPEYPIIDERVKFLTELVGQPDKNTYFIGHSIGGQTILRYLEKINAKVGGVIIVAGWFTLTNLDEEDTIVAKPWVETPIDFEKVKANTSKIVTILSDNDPYVPIAETTNIFLEKLGAEVIIEKQKGHFSREDKITKLPVLLEKFLELV